MGVAKFEKYDVLVVGAGVAGTAAAVAAAEEAPRAHVCLTSAGVLFSGSSFARSTWGMGLISPGDDPDEQEDLARRILEIGDGLADPALARAFVAGIEPAVRRAESWGVRFRTPAAEKVHENAYIACFDDRHRIWRGLERASWKKALSARLTACGVAVRENLELLDVASMPQSTGYLATFFDAREQTFCRIRCASIVLAMGGSTGLWPDSISGPDNASTAYALALPLGARLRAANVIQFMPTIVSPVESVVFNEKTFRYMDLQEKDAATIYACCRQAKNLTPLSELEEDQPPREGEAGQVDRPAPGPREAGQVDRPAPGPREAKPIDESTLRSLLEMRSGYGPFTSRLKSAAVDFAICQSGPTGMELTPRLEADLPEFVQNYFTWLTREQGVSPTEPLCIALRAQASNGGIAIDADGWTGVPGLFAAGECAGGMHGRDRLGGLASASALTFGIAAGCAAARWATDGSSAATTVTNGATRPRTDFAAISSDVPGAIASDSTGTNSTGAIDVDSPNAPEAISPNIPEVFFRWTPHWSDVERELSRIMQTYLGPVRTADDLQTGSRKLHAIANSFSSSAMPISTTSTNAPQPAQTELAPSAQALAASRRTELRIASAQAIFTCASQDSYTPSFTDFSPVCPYTQKSASGIKPLLIFDENETGP